MSVTAIVELRAQPDKLEILRAGISGMVPEALAFDGCEGVTVYENRDDSTLVLIEPWASRDHHERYLGWRTERGDLDALASMLTGPPSIRYFETVDVQSAAGTA